MKLLHQIVALGLCAQASANQLALVPSRDNTLYSESGSTSNGAGQHLFAGRNSAGNTRRALLHFDLAAALPAGSTINSARLFLNVSQANAGAQLVALARVSADWGEGSSDAPSSEGSGTAATSGDATWTQRFFGAAQPWNTAGGDFAPAASAQAGVDGVGWWVFGPASQLTLDVQDMLDVPAANFGWILIGGESGTSTAKRFDSRQNPDPLLRPQLWIEFSPPLANYCVALPNSSGNLAAISWAGSPSLAANQFTLHVNNAAPNQSGVFFFGSSPAQQPFGGGFLCVGGALRRIGLAQLDTTGAAARLLSFTQSPADQISAGQNVYFQFWFRDPAAGMGASNLSDGLRAVFCP